MTPSSRVKNGGISPGARTIGRLSGAPKLTFVQSAQGDTITRKTGTWDADDGFSIGQTIEIVGALNAGSFAIANISNGGKTLVLDVRQVVSELATSALSISGSIPLPPVDSPVRNDDDADSGKRTQSTSEKQVSTRRDQVVGTGKRTTNADAGNTSAKPRKSTDTQKKISGSAMDTSALKRDGDSVSLAKEFPETVSSGKRDESPAPARMRRRSLQSMTMGALRQAGELRMRPGERSGQASRSQKCCRRYAR